MADLKEKLVEIIKEAGSECEDIGDDLWDMRKNAETIADFMIAHGVTVQEWISVKDRLPDKDVKVLTWGVYGFSVNYRDRFSGKWRGVNGRPQWITHWMPLPKPPKGE